MNDMNPEEFDPQLQARLRDAADEQSFTPIYAAAIRAQARKQRRVGWISGGVAVAALAAVAVVLGVTFVPGRSIPATPQPAATPQVTPLDANSDGTGIIVNRGKYSASTPVVAVYLDYQCPICRQFEKTYGASLESLANTGKIQLQYRTMTFLDANLNNDSSTRAAVGAACADVAGVYSAYHDQVFNHQPVTEGQGYSDAVLRDTIPKAIGLSGPALASFQKCYDTQATKAFVTRVSDQALAAGVNGAPTITVNGMTVEWAKLGKPADLGAKIAAIAASAPLGTFYVTPPDASSDGAGIVVNPGKYSASAPVVAYYFDYQCQSCGTAYEKFLAPYGQLAATGGIQLQYRTMTFMNDASGSGHDSSTRAAVASACADVAGVYSAYNKQLWNEGLQLSKTPQDWPDSVLRDTIPASIGLKGSALTTFQQCYNAQATKTFVTGVNEKGLAAGACGMPAVTVNGRFFDGWTNYSNPASLKTAIDAFAAQIAAGSQAGQVNSACNPSPSPVATP